VSGKIETVAMDTAEPSPFSHEILNANPYAYLDDAPLEERRARAVQMRRSLGTDGNEIGALDQAAIDEVFSESWPVVRDADELHDALLTLIVLPPAAEWAGFFEALAGKRRATRLVHDGVAFWVPAEKLTTARRLYSDSVLEPAIEPFERTPAESQSAAATEVVRGWLESTGPTTSSSLAARLALPQETIDAALVSLESTGQVLRGRFSPNAGPVSETEWCNRRLLARIHRMTLGRLRSEIAPVTSAEFVRFLFSWQHIAPGAKLHGVDGALQILKQLQGYEVSAAAWESEVLPQRIARYTPDLLDQLCLSGEVMWGRLSPHPSLLAEVSPRGRRVRPTRVAPVAIFLREDAAWLSQSPDAAEAAGSEAPALSHPARELLETLRQRGASFLPELVKATGRLTSEVEDGLWELAAAGLVTADGFENLRALLDPKRRRGEGHGRFKRPRHAAGRWALLRVEAPSGTRGAWTEAFARQLLERWGVVFRDLLARETLAPVWRDLLMVFRRMEARGEIRGGRFVSGFVGEQFARPEALDLLRALRRKPLDFPLRIAAADPLNLAGIITPGPRISPLAGQPVGVVAGDSVVASGQ
jgi:ATP-dependent Lhr-like helicase